MARNRSEKPQVAERHIWCHQRWMRRNLMVSWWLRVVMVLLITLLSLATSAGSVFAKTSDTGPSSPKTCNWADFGGLLMDRWRELGGPNSPLGCPLEPNERVGWDNRAARIRLFENGQGTWSPYVGGAPVLLAWREGWNIRVWWKNSDSYEYTDKWIVRWDMDGQNIGQDDFHQLPRREGSVTISASLYHEYAILVEGCDSECRGWMHPIIIPARNPGLRAEVRIGGTTRILIDDNRILANVFDQTWGAMRANLKDMIRKSLQEDPSLYGINLDLADRGEVWPRMENGQLVIDYIVRDNWITGKVHVNSGIFGRVANPSFRADYTLILRMAVGMVDQPFTITNASSRIEEPRIETTNLAGDIGARIFPSKLRYALRQMKEHGNIDVTKKANEALAPVAQVLRNLPKGVVVVSVGVDPGGKVLVRFGSR